MITSIVVVSISSVNGLIALQRLVRQSTDPQAVLRTAQSIAQFPQPLPPGYSLLVGGRIFDLSLICIDHAPEHQQLFIYCLQGALGSDKDAKSLLDRAYDVGLNTNTFNAKFIELKESGQTKVADLDMKYRIGTYLDADNKNAQALVGCICVNKPAKNILIYSYPAPGNAYNHKVTMNLLDSIKGF